MKIHKAFKKWLKGLKKKAKKASKNKKGEESMDDSIIADLREMVDSAEEETLYVEPTTAEEVDTLEDPSRIISVAKRRQLMV